jgi:hypothetical protein
MSKHWADDVVLLQHLKYADTVSLRAAPYPEALLQ